MLLNFERLELQVEGPVARVWLNRPEVRNAFDGLMVTELRRAIFDLHEVDAVRVVVLGGRGESFCAGADLQWMKAMAGFDRDENLREAQAMADLFFTVYDSPKPIVARVQGAALGGGAGLVAASDIPVAALGTQFGFTPVQVFLSRGEVGFELLGLELDLRQHVVGDRARVRRGLTILRFRDIAQGVRGIDPHVDGPAFDDDGVRGRIVFGGRHDELALQAQT